MSELDVQRFADALSQNYVQFSCLRGSRRWLPWVAPCVPSTIEPRHALRSVQHD